MKQQYVGSGSDQVFFRGKDVHREKKAWGEEHWIVNKEYCGKKLVLRKNHRCSMHHHREKDEVFYLQSGKVLLELGKKKYTLHPGDFVHVRSNTPHRFTGLEDSEIMEFSTTHDEGDSYRSELSGHIDQERFVRQSSLIKNFRTVSVLVIGDVMLDTYVNGDVERVSPEAPIPVVHHRSSHSVPGGAANAAMNIAALGGKATLLGLCGDDLEGKKLDALIRKGGVRPALIIERGGRTIEKVRVVSNGQQMIRVDYEDVRPLTPTQRQAFLKKLKSVLKKHDALLLSDYAKGMFSSDMLKACVAAARKAKVPVILDPKPRDSGYIRTIKGATVITPNRGEAQYLAGASAAVSPSAIGKTLRKKTGSDVLLTLGGRGMMLVAGAKAQVREFPALAKEVADVSGAGDTVAATLALVLAAGGTLDDGADLSNRAASVVVGKLGTATLTSEELLRVL